MSTGYTLITASRIQDASGKLLSSGRVTFYPVSSAGLRVSAISGGDSGGGPISQLGVSFLVVDGAITTDLFGRDAQVADTALTSPLHIAYRVTITDEVGVEVQGPGYGLVQPSGPSFSLDTYVPYQPLNVTLQPPISISIGTVTFGVPSASVTGIFPNFILNFVLPYSSGNGASYPTALVFADLVTGSRWAYSIVSGAQEYTPMASSVPLTMTPTVLIDTVTGQHYQLAFVNGAFEIFPVASSVAGISQIILEDFAGSGQWVLAITNGAFGITPTSLAGGQVPVGALDGVNASFGLTYPPQLNMLYRNGLFMTPGVDYNMTSSSAFTYTFIPNATDTHYFV